MHVQGTRLHNSTTAIKQQEKQNKPTTVLKDSHMLHYRWLRFKYAQQLICVIWVQLSHPTQ